MAPAVEALAVAQLNPRARAVARPAPPPVSSHPVNDSDPQKDVLDYAAPKARGGGESSPREGRARMIGVAVMFVGAGILMGNREDVLVLVGLALGLFALIAFAVEYARSWRRDDG